MEHYVGLDISQQKTAICIIDKQGTRVAEGKALTLPSDIAEWIAKHTEVETIVKVGLEAGAMSAWLTTELIKTGLPTICLEAYQAHLFLKTQRNKTDKNDARGLAQLVRMGGDFIKPVLIRSQASQEARTLLTMRQHLVEERLRLENNITGILKPYGLITPRGHICARTFRARFLETLQRAEKRGLHVHEAVLPSLDIHDDLCKQLSLLTKRCEALARANPVCRRLMTVPGVGSIIALSFVSSIDDPRRFKKSCDVGAYLGLTPQQYQSGETDIRGNTSRRGDGMTRTHLVQAATVLLTCTKKWCALKAWGMKIAKRHGFCKARIAVARKLASVLHKMWMTQQDFCWTSQPATTLSVGKTSA